MYIDDYINIYEHQSTFNPNMPLRSLIYFLKIVKKYFKYKDLFSRRLIKLPTPHFVVFYNGEENRPEKEEPEFLLGMLARLICLIGALSVIISQFNNMFYEFDAHNFYHRNAWYPAIQILAIINLFVLAAEVLRHRNCFSKLESLALLVYFVLPIIAMVLLIFIYGISFLNLAISICGLLMFLVQSMREVLLVRGKH